MACAARARSTAAAISSAVGGCGSGGGSTAISISIASCRPCAVKSYFKAGAPVEPEGWRTGVHEDSSQVWLTLRGPEGQQAAFAVPNVGIRAEILRGYRAALTKFAARSVCDETKGHAWSGPFCMMCGAQREWDPSETNGPQSSG